MNKAHLFILLRLTLYALILTMIAHTGTIWISIGMGICYVLIELIWYIQAYRAAQINLLINGYNIQHKINQLNTKSINDMLNIFKAIPDTTGQDGEGIPPNPTNDTDNKHTDIYNKY